ncbi:MAG: DUF4251 domain-containing protein [Chitinophagales bacterium]
MALLKSIFLFAALSFIAGNSTALAQNNDKQQKAAAEATAMKNLIESQHYMFLAQTMMPQSGPTRPISTPYDLRIRKDTLSADLPYIGRAFSSDYGSSDNALSFKTTSFTYTKNDGKNGGWDITIVPKGVRNVSKMFLKISSSGFASLSVQSNTRQSISYNGNIQPIN